MGTEQVESEQPTRSLHAIIPDIFETGCAASLPTGFFSVLLDCEDVANDFEGGRVKIFTWRWKDHKFDGGYLFILKAWRTPFKGERKLRLQCHKIRADGTWGRRIVIRETVRGRPVVRNMGYIK